MSVVSASVSGWPMARAIVRACSQATSASSYSPACVSAQPRLEYAIARPEPWPIRSNSSISPAVVRDRFGVSTPLELGEAEVDQAAADLLDAADTLGELEAPAQAAADSSKRPSARYASPVTRIGAAERPASRPAPRADPPHESMGQTPRRPDRRESRHARDEHRDVREWALGLGCRLDPGLQHVHRLVDVRREIERPARLQPQRREIGILQLVGGEGFVHGRERRDILAALPVTSPRARARRARRSFAHA